MSQPSPFKKDVEPQAKYAPELHLRRRIPLERSLSPLHSSCRVKDAGSTPCQHPGCCEGFLELRTPCNEKRIKYAGMRPQ